MTVFDSLLLGTGSETVYAWPKFLYSKKFWTWVNLPFMHRGQRFLTFHRLKFQDTPLVVKDFLTQRAYFVALWEVPRVHRAHGHGKLLCSSIRHSSVEAPLSLLIGLYRLPIVSTVSKLLHIRSG